MKKKERGGKEPNTTFEAPTFVRSTFLSRTLWAICMSKIDEGSYRWLLPSQAKTKCHASSFYPQPNPFPPLAGETSETGNDWSSFKY